MSFETLMYSSNRSPFAGRKL